MVLYNLIKTGKQSFEDFLSIAGYIPQCNMYLGYDHLGCKVSDDPNGFKNVVNQYG